MASRTIDRHPAQSLAHRKGIAHLDSALPLGTLGTLRDSEGLSGILRDSQGFSGTLRDS